MISKKLENQVRKNWEKASKELNFEIISPYYLQIAPNDSKEVFAFLPDCNTNGTLIGLICEPYFETDSVLAEYSKKNNIFCSFINIDCFLKYERDYFREILTDWGHTGQVTVQATQKF